MVDAFAMADDVLHSGVRGITDLMIIPGLVNLDFADVRAVMSEMGKAMMGTGEAEGENRAKEAAEAAISNPLLDEVSMKGAAGVLINITGGMDLSLFEVDEAANRIRSEVDPDANILVGTALDPSLDGKMRVSVVATGITAEGEERPIPTRTYDFSATPTTQTPKTEEAVSPIAAVAEKIEVGVSVLDTATEEPLELTNIAKTENDDLIGQLDVEMISEPVSTAPSVDEDKDAPFIAPSPILPDEAVSASFSTEHGDLEMKSDPFAEAAMMNAAPEKKTEAPKKLGGLFSSLKNRNKNLENTTQKMTSDVVNQGDLLVAEPKEVKASSGISTLTAGERIAPKISSEDNLKIPAFLRRQAN
jgi:cell division protein FtsZ